MSDSEEIKELICCACGKLLDSTIEGWYQVGDKRIHEWCFDLLLKESKSRYPTLFDCWGDTSL